MQNSGNGLAKLIIAVLAVLCIVLAVVFFVKNKPDCSQASSQPEQSTDYSYQEDFSVSGGDITFEDNSTEEMDTIPNDADSPASTASSSDN